VCGLIGSEPAGCELDVWHVATWGSDVTGDGSEDSPFFTIQHGLNRAQPGQTVLVHCGAYFEHEIVMKSGVILTSETGAPGCVTVDANEECRVFSVIGADDATVIEGLTITGGTSGGMYCAESFLTIRNCLFTGNTTDGYGGGGLHCHYASPTLEHCAFVENASVQYGAGMYCYESSPKLLDCLFEGNKAGYDAGAVYCRDSSMLHAIGCTFRANESTYVEPWGPPVASGAPYPSRTYATGAGAMMSRDGTLVLEGCVFEDNLAHAAGGALALWYTDATLTNCVFLRNRLTPGQPYDTLRGAGIYGGDSNLRITNCTFARNWGADAGDAISFYSHAPYAINVTNSIFRENGSDELRLYGDTLRVAYCCVAGGYEGEGNLDLDPRFADIAAGDLTLLADSPCIDAGTPEGAPDTDLRGLPRPLGAGVDLGAFEYFVGEGHDADWHNGTDLRIDLTELLRLIQLYKAGGYHCAAAGETTDDGFAPYGDAAGQDCFPHDLDYNPPDGRISFAELLRAVQFYNSPACYPCTTGEDGFCPGR